MSLKILTLTWSEKDKLKEKIVKTSGQNKAAVLQMLKAVEQKGFTTRVEFFAGESIDRGFSVNRVAILAVPRDMRRYLPPSKPTQIEESSLVLDDNN